MTRPIHHRYSDPLDQVWIGAAARIGLRVRRSDEVFASTDGRGTLTLGAPDTLDADDCVAQMVFHELCHSLVQGPASFEQPDWGLDNLGPRDLAREHAALRVQATLARRHGLQHVLAPTTEHRAFYDRLGLRALEGDGPDLPLSRLGVRRASREPWAPHLEAALEATRAIVGHASAWAGDGSLFARLEARRPLHPSGLYAEPSRGYGCGDCAWRVDGRCLKAAEPGAKGPEVGPELGACEGFEGAVECGACGACCREAYDVLELAPGDPFGEAHPGLVERVDGRVVLRRVDGRCPPLRGSGTPSSPYRCGVYEERPQTCRDFTRGTENCLDARRRIGLSV